MRLRDLFDARDNLLQIHGWEPEQYQVGPEVCIGLEAQAVRNVTVQEDPRTGVRHPSPEDLDPPLPLHIGGIPVHPWPGLEPNVIVMVAGGRRYVYDLNAVDDKPPPKRRVNDLPVELL